MNKFLNFSLTMALVTCCTNTGIVLASGASTQQPASRDNKKEGYLFPYHLDDIELEEEDDFLHEEEFSEDIDDLFSTDTNKGKRELHEPFSLSLYAPSDEQIEGFIQKIQEIKKKKGTVKIVLGDNGRYFNSYDYFDGCIFIDNNMPNTHPKSFNNSAYIHGSTYKFYNLLKKHQDLYDALKDKVDLIWDDWGTFQGSLCKCCSPQDEKELTAENYKEAFECFKSLLTSDGRMIMHLESFIKLERNNIVQEDKIEHFKISNGNYNVFSILDKVDSDFHDFGDPWRCSHPIIFKSLNHVEDVDSEFWKMDRRIDLKELEKEIRKRGDAVIKKNEEVMKKEKIEAKEIEIMKEEIKEEVEEEIQEKLWKKLKFELREREYNKRCGFLPSKYGAIMVCITFKKD